MSLLGLIAPCPKHSSIQLARLLVPSPRSHPCFHPVIYEPNHNTWIIDDIRYAFSVSPAVCCQLPSRSSSTTLCHMLGHPQSSSNLNISACTIIHPVTFSTTLSQFIDLDFISIDCAWDHHPRPSVRIRCHQQCLGFLSVVIWKQVL